MDKNSAISLLEKTFKNSFDMNNYVTFLKELFNKSNIRPRIYDKIRKEFWSYENEVYILGDYEDDYGDSIALYAIELSKQSLRDRARTMQRNLIASLIKDKYDSALVAFYEPNLEDWRFSHVKVEYEFNEKGIKEKLSSPIRHSFLVGVNEPNHTCQSQFLDLICNEGTVRIKDIEHAFNIENVTNEFFNKYKELFLQLTESLEEVKENDNAVKLEFDKKNIKSSDFSKKLMGQIVFIYFLQKKGWLGVEKDDKWGSGPKNFFNIIFDNCIAEGNNFFNDVLEPLFYEGLSEEVSDDHYSMFNYKVPFLNGGLFEPINNYNWRDTDIILDNSIFEEIINTFNQFNFTVKEDEPLEKEVAVDPEMLGKVFENLLEIVDRKSKGAFYTPRYIVHYMCQESLISYLNTNSDIPEEDLRVFITNGELAINSIIRANEEKKKYNGHQYTRIELPDSIKENSDLLESLLQKVKVIDPAVGSGAFPVGMMNEIVKARYILYLLAEIEDINLYDLKRETIENSLYGVDIELSATDVTKLRFWLSLIVDEEHMEEIRPLPNLDNQIMCGNSLVDRYDNIYLFDKSLIKRSGQQKLMITPVERAFNDLERKKMEYFKTTGPQTKIKLKKEINALKWNFIEKRIENFNPKLIEDIRKYEHSQLRPFFVWELEFSEIFKGDNPGFDIVIGNPPYVSNKGIDKELMKQYREIFGIRDDLYNYFFLKGFDLLKNEGVLSFITPDTYLTIESKINLRELFQKNRVIEIIKIKNVFESAKVDNAIMSVKKTEASNTNYTICFKDADGSFLNPETYYTDIDKYRTYPNKVFFVPNELNLTIYSKYKDKINDLENEWLDKIKTSKTIEKNKKQLNKYRNNLEPGDVTLLGLITEGGQGLATANNGKYVGILENTKGANKILESRPKKLFEAINARNITDLKFIKDVSAAREFLGTKSEIEIRKLFDDLKDEYGRDIFGQGYLFRIVSPNEIANISSLSSKDKEYGIKNGPSYVLYDKGDKEGNRYYLESPYYIDWSEDNVSFLKSNSGKKGKGMPVVRNPDFYFKSGFCWNNVLDTQSKFIKCRLKSESIHDVASMSLFPVVDSMTAKYLVCMLNSTFLYHYQRTFVNNTVNLQMNDFRQHPIIVPSQEQLEIFESIFDDAYNIKLQYFDKTITKAQEKEKLDEIQLRLDNEVNKLYGVTIE